MAKRKPWSERLEIYRRNHGGLTPYQVQRSRAESVGLTPYRIRRAREQRKLGPAPQAIDSVLWLASNAPSIDQMRAANERWVTPEGLDRYAGGGFSGFSQSISSAQRFGYMANQYLPELGRLNPAYVIAFYNAIVNPRTNYGSIRNAEGAPLFDPRTGKRRTNNAFLDYVRKFGADFTRVPQDQVDLWLGDRYSMALIDTREVDNNDRLF